MGEPLYRLVRKDEPIERGDQVLLDDCETWGDLRGWEVGMKYQPGGMVPLRRPLEKKDDHG